MKLDISDTRLKPWIALNTKKKIIKFNRIATSQTTGPEIDQEIQLMPVGTQLFQLI